MKSEMADMEGRLRILEEKLEYQDYTMEKLSEVLVGQQRQLDKLEGEVHSLRQKIEVFDDNREAKQTGTFL